MLPSISWQITSSGQTKKGTDAAGGRDIFFVPHFPLFFWLPVCKGTSAEGHFVPPHLERHPQTPQTGRTVASPLTCGAFSYLLLSQDS